MCTQAPGGSPNSSAGRSGAGALVIGAYSPQLGGARGCRFAKLSPNRSCSKKPSDPMLDGNGAGCGDAASDRSFFYPTAPPEWYSVSSAGRPGSGVLAHGSCSPSAGRGVGRGVRNSEQSGESAPHRPSQLRGYGLRGERDRSGPTGGAVRGPLRKCRRAKTTRNMPRRRRAPRIVQHWL